MINHDWPGTAARLARIAAHPGAGEVFGAKWHEWRLQPPLTEDEVAEVESQLHVTLPAEYRGFLLQVSRGGAGPGCELFDLRRTDGVWRWHGDGGDLTDRERLWLPFEHTEAFNPADVLPERPDDRTFDTEDEYDRADDAWWELHDAAVFAPEHSIGLLYLCHLGGAYREALVVSGAARGQMWADDRAAGTGLRPLLRPDGSRVDFRTWYQTWLHEAEQQLAI
ncbi:SMI1/KNR4 family protein [Paractinoplanes deccanensis]|uniref:SMI1/KNR4 family protein n=1 Tax=Paractinoplanes deccanensis TaxID=113561 RepID=UPI001EF220DD|nr:SMI1/KNR4 family protein [Actinoplanes deccanensis]